MLASPMSPILRSFDSHDPIILQKGGPTSPLASLAPFTTSTDVQLVTPRRAERRPNMELSLSALPVELISRILTTTLHSQPQSEEPKVLAKLLSLSARLRDVALSTPSLWTTLKITDAGVNARTLLHLQRSGVLPLDVQLTVRCRNHKTMPCKEGVQTLMESLAALKDTMSRWRTLDLNLPSCWLTQEALANCGDMLPNLEVLTVRTGHSDTGDYATPLPSVLVHMPRLHTINFHWYNFRWVSPANLGSVRTIRLASYYMDDPTLVPELLEMLRACPNLEHLELDTISERWVPRLSQPEAFEPVVLKDLKNITLRDCGQEKAKILLRDIRCPSVTSISLESIGNINGLLEVLCSDTHSWESLAEVSVTACEFKADAFMQWLKRVPSLRKVDIRDCPRMNMTVSGLVESASTMPPPSPAQSVQLRIAEGKQFSTLYLPASISSVQ